MSGLLLDTDTLVELARGNARAITDRYVAALANGTALRVSAVSVFEFRYGMERSSRHAVQGPAFEQLLSRMTVAPFDQTDADRTARLKADLAAKGRMIGAYDLMIAGQALARGWTVVSGNVREFARIDGLATQDWRSPA